MPLTEKVTFKAALQKQNRVQIPIVIRWQFKIETTQALKVGVSLPARWKTSQFFYAKMQKGGRIAIPERTMSLLQGDNPSLEGSLLEVTLEPFQSLAQ